MLYPGSLCLECRGGCAESAGWNSGHFCSQALIRSSISGSRTAILSAMYELTGGNICSGAIFIRLCALRHVLVHPCLSACRNTTRQIPWPRRMDSMVAKEYRVISSRAKYI